MMDILNDARKYLVDSLKGQSNGHETKHPWRKSWQFAVLHSLRVEAYAVQILAHEPHPLSEDGVGLIRLAAILHDIARLGRRDIHAQAGAEIAGKWLRANSGALFTNSDVEKITGMIADHPNKENHNGDFSSGVLKDADVLDEIGIMSIFMTSNWVEKESPFFFHHLRQRVIEHELPFCDRAFAVLNTSTARKILQEKKTFIENFAAQMTDELQADSEIEQLLLGLSQDNPR